MIIVSRNAWQENIAQTQLIIRQQPDTCFVCGEAVGEGCPSCLIQAFLEKGHTQRLAVVCERPQCLKELSDTSNGTWQRLFDGLTHWPDKAIYPHGPYWVVKRPHQFTFRTDPRRTTDAV
jgi:hypothetical protein